MTAVSDDTIHTSYLSIAMQIKPGILLVSVPDEADPLFDKAVVFIAEYNAKGALGFVLSHLFTRKFNELEEFNLAKPLPLFDGGPVEREHLFFLHRRPDCIEGGDLITGNSCFGGNFKQAVQCCSNNMIAENDLQLFIGYCGWDAGQLEAEIAEGSWLVIDEGEKYLFKQPGNIDWEAIYAAYK